MDELGAQQAIKARHGDRAPVAGARPVMQPLPQLRATDLGGRGVLHQVVQRHAAVAAQPGLRYRTDADAAAHPRFRDLTSGTLSRSAAPTHVLAQHAELIGPVHRQRRRVARHRGQPRVRDPGAVASGARLAQLVARTRAMAASLACGSSRIDLRGYAAHGVRAAPVTGANEQIHVRLEEVTLHVTVARSGSRQSWRLRNFLMKLKM
jgi:hypothetical protein